MSHERAWNLRAADHDDKAEAGRAEKKKTFETSHGMPDHVRENLSRTYDTAIGHHANQARIYRRRSEHARAGYVLDSPDERRDSEYMHAHGDLIRTARGAGRVRYTDEPAPGDDD